MLACLAQDNTFISPSKAKKENRTESELTTEELDTGACDDICHQRRFAGLQQI